MATDYRDDTALTDAQKASLVGLATAIRTKMYGKDVREAIASAIEMVGAPGVNSYFTPKGIKANLAALQTAYPTGTDGIWITQDDGYWNFWNGTAWQKGQPYQAAGIADNSVKVSALMGNIGIGKTDDLNYHQITPNVLDVNLTETVGDDNIYWQHYAHSCKFSVAFKANNSVRIPILVSDVLPDIGNIFRVTFKAASVSSDSTANTLAVSIVDSNNNVLKSVGTLTRTTSYTKYYFDISDFEIPDGSYLLITGNDTFTCDFDNMVICQKEMRNNDDLYQELQDFHDVKNNIEPFYQTDALLEKLVAWNSTAYTSTIIQNEHFAYQKITSDVGAANGGLWFYFSVDNSKDLYIKITAAIAGTGTGSIFFSGDGNVKSNAILGTLQANAPLKTFYLKISKEQLANYGITNYIFLGIGNGKTITSTLITDLAISQFAFGQNVPESLNHLNEFKTDQIVEKVGQDLIDIASGTTITSSDYLLATPKQNIDFPKGKLKYIEAYVEADGTKIFYVGTLDQNSLLVNQTSYSVYLNKGYNKIDVSDKNIYLKQGEQFFMDMSGENLYQTSSTFPNFNGCLLQDSSHSTNNSGYSGYNFYEVDLICPFSYTVRSLNSDELYDEFSTSINNLSTDTSNIISKIKSKQTLTSPDGTRYRISVSDDGTLSAAKIKPTGAIFFGNSLTTHSALQGIGMAAPDQNSDFAALVTAHLKTANSSLVSSKVSISTWEADTSSTDRSTFVANSMMSQITSSINYIFVQIGDNINTDKKHTSFETDLNSMIQALKSANSSATIILIGSWFNSYSDIETIMQSVADSNGVDFVNIKSLNTLSNQSVIGNTISLPDGTTYTVESSGVAVHPGKVGHEAIAKAVINVLDF